MRSTCWIAATPRWTTSSLRAPTRPRRWLPATSCIRASHAASGSACASPSGRSGGALRSGSAVVHAIGGEHRARRVRLAAAQLRVVRREIRLGGAKELAEIADHEVRLLVRVDLVARLHDAQEVE